MPESCYTSSMKTFEVPIGDWGKDGHSQCDLFCVSVPDKFSKEALNKNYDKNKELFGFSTKDFVAEYQDSRLPAEKYRILEEYGLKFRWQISNQEYSQAPEDNPHPLDEDPDNVRLDPDDMLDIVMFYFGHGLEGFSWQEVKYPSLLGTYNSGYFGSGYGLYF